MIIKADVIFILKYYWLSQFNVNTISLLFQFGASSGAIIIHFTFKLLDGSDGMRDEQFCLYDVALLV